MEELSSLDKLAVTILLSLPSSVKYLMVTSLLEDVVYGG
jgi:hypothetical protein